jgi:hypothetical protein
MGKYGAEGILVNWAKHGEKIDTKKGDKTGKRGKKDNLSQRKKRDTHIK